MPGHSDWSRLPLAERVKRACALRHALAEDPGPFLEAVRLPFRRSAAETLAAEIIPLADACAFLERNAAKALRPRRLGLSGRPLWLMGVDAEIRREPLGTVLIIAPQNYPLMLAGIQAVQALVAGNRVLWKPAPGTRAGADLLAGALAKQGVPPEALIILDEAVESIQPWLPEVDKVVLTGSQRSGRAVLRDLALRPTPAVMELSGCDPMVVLPGADLDLVARSIRFGLTFNGSATCIAPRRVLVDRSIADALADRLRPLVATISPLPVPEETRHRLAEAGESALRDGAKLLSGQLPCPEIAPPLVFDHARAEMQLLQEDFMAPITSLIRVANADEALRAAAQSPYRLGASVFGPIDAARDVADRIGAGCVVINDLIVPTADPRLPFGGSGGSGFGVTRGVEGLLEMTRVKTISIRRRGPRFHLRLDDPNAADLVAGQLKAAHGGNWRARLAGLAQSFAALRRQFRG